MKRILSLLLTVSVFCTVFAVSAVSADAALWIKDYRYGDVDQDDDVTSVDAVMIQRNLIDAQELSKVGHVAADYDHDREVSIIDVTLIQRSLSNMKLPENCGGTFTDQNRIVQFCGTYCSGKVIAGVPVTYTVKAETGTSVVDYTFTAYKEGTPLVIIASQSSLDDHFTVAFDEPGWYVVSVRSTDEINERDLSTRYHTEYVEVVKPYSIKNPVINNYYFDTVENGSELTVGVIGGTVPYQYSYTVPSLYTKSTVPYHDDYWDSSVDDSGEMTLTTGYIDSDTVPLLPWELTDYAWNHYEIIVTAKDANGVESEPFIIQAPEIVEG